MLSEVNHNFGNKPEKTAESKVSRAVRLLENLLEKYEDAGPLTPELTEINEFKIRYLKYYLQLPGFEDPGSLPIAFNTSQGKNLRNSILIEAGLDKDTMPMAAEVRKYMRLRGVYKTDIELEGEISRQKRNTNILSALKLSLMRAEHVPSVIKGFLIDSLSRLRDVNNNERLEGYINALIRILDLILTPKAEEGDPKLMYRRNHEVAKLIGLASEKPEHLSANLIRNYNEVLRQIGLILDIDLKKYLPHNFSDLRRLAGIGTRASDYESLKPKIEGEKNDRAIRESSAIREILGKVSELIIELENKEWMNTATNDDRELLAVAKYYLQNIAGHKTVDELQAKYGLPFSTTKIQSLLDRLGVAINDELPEILRIQQYRLRIDSGPKANEERNDPIEYLDAVKTLVHELSSRDGIQNIIRKEYDTSKKPLTISTLKNLAGSEVGSLLKRNKFNINFLKEFIQSSAFRQNIYLRAHDRALEQIRNKDKMLFGELSLLSIYSEYFNPKIEIDKTVTVRRLGEAIKNSRSETDKLHSFQNVASLIRNSARREKLFRLFALVLLTIDIDGRHESRTNRQIAVELGLSIHEQNSSLRHYYRNIREFVINNQPELSIILPKTIEDIRNGILPEY